MALPAGITTCTVTLGPAYSYTGEEGVISGTVSADRNVIWGATGAPVFGVSVASTVIPSAAGGQVSFVVPHVNQAGFKDGSGNDITGWYYRFDGRVTFDGNRVENITKRFQVFTGQTTVDLDLVPDGPVIPGVTVPSQYVTSVNGQTGAVTLDGGGGGAGDSDVAGYIADPESETAGALSDSIAESVGAAGDDIAGSAVQKSALGIGYGLDGNSLRDAVEKSPTIGPNLWQLEHFSPFAQAVGPNGAANTTTLTPTVTADGTTKSVHTRIDIRTIRKDTSSKRFRVAFDITTTPITMTGFTPVDVRLAVLKPDGTPSTWWDYRHLLQTNPTVIVELSQGDAPMNAHRMVVEIDADNATSNGVQAYLDLWVNVNAGHTAGSVTLSNVTVHEVPSLSPLLRVGWDRTPGANAQVVTEIPGFDNALTPRFTRYTLGPDNTVGLSPVGAQVWHDASVTSSRFKIGAGNGSDFRVGDFFINNSDFIHLVALDNGGSEYLGNTHGGEAGRSGTYSTDYQLFADFGDGTWTRLDTYDNWAYYAFKAKVVTHTKITRTDQPGSPYANVDRTFYLYPDGTMRKDFTVTFLKDQAMPLWLWDMSSFQPGAFATGVIPNSYRGRIGRGSAVIAETDMTARLPVPDTTYPTFATTGGTIAGGFQYGVIVTALNGNGETTGSIKRTLCNVGASTNTNAVTANWATVEGATGYAVYFGLPGYEKRVAVVGSGATSYTVLGSETPSSVSPPRTNGAVTQTASDNISVHNADWACYYDRSSGAVFSMCIDHTAVATQPGIQGIYGRLHRIDGGIMKNYWPVEFAQDDSIEPYVIPAGSVYTGTTWRFVYFPRDPDRFEAEQTIRGAAVQQLPAIYPTSAGDDGPPSGSS